MPDPVDTIPDPPIPAILDGRYRIHGVLGTGGMGRVYRAEHVGLSREVAIKVLDPQLLCDDSARRRFEREAQATSRLRHPNCVGVTDFGAMPDGSPYLVMDLVEGVTLDDLLFDEQRLPLSRAVHIMRHLLAGLAHAHAQGLVHRDLKPANIMLVTDGADRDLVRILDFGLARLIDGGGGDRVTRTGIVCGTPRYMSPEQALDRAIDPRTDLYAASVLLFEMLAGRTPFESDQTIGLLKLHLSAPVPRIAEVAPDVEVPPAVEALIRRGLGKSPDERPASAEQYLAELERAYAGDATIELSGSLASVIVPAAPPLPPSPSPAPAPAPSSPTVVAPPRPRPTRRQLAIAGGAVAAVLLIGVVVAAGRDDGAAAPAAAPAEPEPEPIELEAESARDPEIAAAMKLARAGRRDEAVSQLRKLQRRRPDDARVAFALGRVYDQLGWPKQTIDAYRQALRLDPALREDATLIGDLIELLDSRSTWQLAARVLEREVGAPAASALDATAARHSSPTVRGRAARIRDKLAP